MRPATSLPPAISHGLTCCLSEPDFGGSTGQTRTQRGVKTTPGKKTCTCPVVQFDLGPVLAGRLSVTHDKVLLSDLLAHAALPVPTNN